MKKLFAILLAGLMMLSMVACDLGDTEDPNKDNPGVSQSGENNDDNPNMRFDFYLKDETLQKIDSLGKCEDGKKIVKQFVGSSYVSIEIYTWSDPNATYDGYEKYYFYNNLSGLEKDLANDAKLEQYVVVEENRDDLWLKFELKDGIVESGYEPSTYKTIYDGLKYSPLYDLVE